MQIQCDQDSSDRKNSKIKSTFKQGKLTEIWRFNINRVNKEILAVFYSNWLKNRFGILTHKFIISLHTIESINPIKTTKNSTNSEIRLLHITSINNISFSSGTFQLGKERNCWILTIAQTLVQSLFINGDIV